MRLVWAAAALTVAPTLAAASVKDRRATPSPPTPQGPNLFGGYSYTHSGDASQNGWDLWGSPDAALAVLLVDWHRDWTAQPS